VTTDGRLADRVAVVTGGGRGIGAATARLFADHGARVVVNDRDADVAEETSSAISRGGGQAVHVAGDCADPAVARRIADTAVDAFGTIDVLVCSTGSMADGVFHALDDEDWVSVHRDMVSASIAVVRACLVEMRGRAQSELAASGAVGHQRKIVLTSAASHVTGSPGQANLTAAAGAVVGLTRTLARELGGFGINVNAVAPGFIETRLTAAQGADDRFGVAEPIRQMTKAMTALGRYGSPSDVAHAHLFLASRDADFVTGVTLPVTGGMLGTFA
jgi:3-oxoacyl-[acyl-carrier protein] reductase